MGKLPGRSKLPHASRDHDEIIGNDILNISTGLSQTPVVVVAQSSYNRTHQNNVDVKTRTGNHDENYPVYSTALIITIGIGCTLLLLNILVFVAVYYRDKSNRRRHHHSCQRRKRHHEHCDSSCSVSNSSLRDTPDICTKICKPPVENGGIKANFASSEYNQ